MRNLIITLLATSSVDSLNPIGITQQFVLQGMVKKPKHIWYFILTTGVVNMIFGYFVYYGIMAIINNIFNRFLTAYGWLIYSLELLLGLGLLFWGSKSLLKYIINIKRNDKTNEETLESKEVAIKSKIKRVTPIALIGIGIVSTVSELTSAVPYFAFLAVLITHKLTFPMLTLLFICYNIIYIAPFVLLYVIYIISKQKFDNIYSFFKKTFMRYSGLLIPVLLLAISVAILFDAGNNLTNLF